MSGPSAGPNPAHDPDPHLSSRLLTWPNALTALRVVLVIPVVILTMKRTEFSDWVAFFAFGVAALTDGLDGALARRLRLVTSSGQLLDPLADKLLVTCSMVALIIVGRFPAWAAAIILLREVLVTALRLVASSRGRGFPASMAGKAKTGSQLVAVLLFIVPGAGLGWRIVRDVWLGVALVLTVYSGLDYFRRAPALLGLSRQDAG